MKKRQPKKTDRRKKLKAVSHEATGGETSLPGGEVNTDSKSTAGALPCTPKRRRGRSQTAEESYHTSTPLRSSSTEHLSQVAISPPVKRNKDTPKPSLAKTSATDVKRKPDTRQRPRRGRAAQPKQIRRRVTRGQTQSSSGSSSSSPPAKRMCDKEREIQNPQRDSRSQKLERCRPRLELDQAVEDDSLLSSDLSIELCQYEEPLPTLSLEEDEESCDEDELPSFLMQLDKKPPSITEGTFVWSKFRNYPFWPALVKSVNRKLKKASIMFIDYPIIHTKKGITVSLKTLKPYDCEEADELLCKAKENYDAVIQWSLDLISDYSRRIACGSFSGSFIDYFAHDISYPVRKNYPEAAKERLVISDDSMMEEQSDDHKDDSCIKQQEEVGRSSKRLLPDRTHAAHNRANEKLVNFIVKQRMVEDRLLAVIRGKEQSRWLRSFQTAKRKQVVNIYLEDDHQLDQVYSYLNELYTSAVSTAPPKANGKFMESVSFVLDVLLPEAIIYAIAGVDKVTVKKAEEKYMRGRCISNRERQEFDLMIEKQMRQKSQPTENCTFTAFHKLENGVLYK